MKRREEGGKGGRRVKRRGNMAPSCLPYLSKRLPTPFEGGRAKKGGRLKGEGGGGEGGGGAK